MIDPDYYSRYAYGSTRLGSEHDAEILSHGRGPVAQLGNTVIRLRPEEPCIVFGGAGSGKGQISVFISPSIPTLEASLYWTCPVSI